MMDDVHSDHPSTLAGPLRRLHSLTLPSPTAPASSATNSSASASAASAGSSVTHHLLPKSLSPRNDLAILFSTVAPASKAAAAAASGAPAPNFAGMSAAQRLIQQRVAMMRARAAAAAGMAASDSATSSTDTGPIKGQPIEVSLWRVAQTGADLVWRQPLKVPDTLFVPRKKGREHETVTVLSTEWSPDGRTIAIHFAVCRVSVDDGVSREERAMSLLALYAVQDGSLLSLSITSSPNASSSMPPPGVDMTWIEWDMALADRSDVPGSSAYAAAQSIHLPLDLNPLLALAAPSTAGSSASRFHSIMGNQGVSSGPSKSSLVLPSQKGLESEHSPSAQDRQLQDPLWAWQALRRVQPAGKRPLDLLLVPTCDEQDRQGVAVLAQGRVLIAFAPLKDGAVLSSTFARGDLFLTSLRCQQGTSGGEPSLTLEVVKRPLLHLVDRASATALYHILDLGSRLRSSMAQVLDLNHILVSIYRTLRAPAAHVFGSLSVQQTNSLPPLSRLHRADHILTVNHAESLKRHIVVTLCTGTYSSMVETMLLNTLMGSKWRAIYEETVRIYEAVEVIASEMSRTLEDAGRMIRELRGWADWPERSSSILPAAIEIEGQPPVPLLQHLIQVAQTISDLKSTTHQVLQYAQGERLAWGEMHKWTAWERTRFELLRSDVDHLPSAPKNFDPVVVVDFVQRDYESFELDWLLLHERKTRPTATTGAAGTADPAHARGDDTEESFVVFEEKQPKSGERQDERLDESQSQVEQLKSPSAQQSSGVAKSRQPAPARVPLRSRMQSTLRWLRDEESEAPQSGEAAGPSSSADAPSPASQPGNERPALFQPGPATALAQVTPPIYDVAHPVTEQLLDLVRDIKSVFVGKLPYIAGGDTDNTVLWRTSLPLQPGRRQGEEPGATGGDDNDEPDTATSWASRDMDSPWSPRVSPAAAQMDPTVRARILALQRCAHNAIIPGEEPVTGRRPRPGKPLQYQLMLADRHRGRILGLRVPLPSDGSLAAPGDVKAAEIDAGNDFERMHVMPDGRRLVVFKSTADPGEQVPAEPEVAVCDLDAFFHDAVAGAASLQRFDLQMCDEGDDSSEEADDDEASDDCECDDSLDATPADAGHDAAFIETSNSTPLAVRLVRRRAKAGAGAGAGAEDERRPGSKYGGWTRQEVEFWR